MKQKAYPIKEVIKDILKDIRKRKQQIPKELNWTEIAGPELAQHTKFLGIKRKVIYVEVDSTTLLSELTHFRKPEIFQRIRTLYPDLKCRDIKFKMKQ